MARIRISSRSSPRPDWVARARIGAPMMMPCASGIKGAAGDGGDGTASQCGEAVAAFRPGGRAAPVNNRRNTGDGVYGSDLKLRIGVFLPVLFGPAVPASFHPLQPPTIGRFAMANRFPKVRNGPYRNPHRMATA